MEAESALDLAAAAGHVDVIKAIAQREPSLVNAAGPGTESGYRALHLAAKHSQIGSIDALIEAGANVEAKGGEEHDTALHAAVESPDCEATLRSLLGHGANIESARLGGITPLGLAVQIGNMAAVDALAAAGADVSKSLLHDCPSEYSEAMTSALLRWGADVNARSVSDGNTPLHFASEKMSLSRVDILLRAGADETAVNGEGKTPADVIGRRADFWVANEDGDKIRTLLVNAPRERAWSRRGFFLLCRAFPGRLRLQPGHSEGEAIEGYSPKPCASDGPSFGRTTKKRASTAGARSGEEEQLAGGRTEEGAATVRTAMVRFIDLEADVVFRKIVEFL